MKYAITLAGTGEYLLTRKREEVDGKRNINSSSLYFRTLAGLMLELHLLIERGSTVEASSLGNGDKREMEQLVNHWFKQEMQKMPDGTFLYHALPPE